MDKILVTGGTGLLGREMINQLIAQKQKVEILSSQAHPNLPKEIVVFKGNLVTGEGLAEAVAEAKTIIHCASNPLNFDKVDVLGTQNLLKAIGENQSPHLIYISIVGVDRSNYPYYMAKKQVEDLISESGVPFTILRTTQFHHFVHRMLKGFLITEQKIVKLPEGMKFQSVAITEVAEKLISISKNKPAGLLPAYGGPEILTFEEMLEVYLSVLKKKVTWKAISLSAPRYELFCSGVNICEDNASGTATWLDFLKEQSNAELK